MRVCITGGAGFIGSHLVEALVARGDSVTVIDNFSTGSRENLADIEKDITLVEGDILDAVALKQAMAGTDLAFHLAAITSVPYSMEHPEETREVNVGGTKAVLDAAVAAGAKRMVFAGSAAEYGDSSKPRQHEDDDLNPLSPYAEQKIESGRMCRRYAGDGKIEAVVLRFFNIFGPRQDANSPYSGVITKFIVAMLASERPTIFGDGSATRDFVYVDNIVSSCLLAADALKEASGSVYNIGMGTPTSVLELVKVLNEILETDLQPIFDPPREGDLLHSLADISRAKEILGYKVKVDFKEGLKRTVDWYRTTPSSRNPR